MNLALSVATAIACFFSINIVLPAIGIRGGYSKRPFLHSCILLAALAVCVYLNQDILPVFFSETVLVAWAALLVGFFLAHIFYFDRIRFSARNGEKQRWVSVFPKTSELMLQQLCMLFLLLLMMQFFSAWKSIFVFILSIAVTHIFIFYDHSFRFGLLAFVGSIVNAFLFAFCTLYLSFGLAVTLALHVAFYLFIAPSILRERRLTK